MRDRILLLPAELPALSGLGVLRAGVELGELRKNRIEPAHGMFMAAKAAQCRSVLHLRHDDPRLLAFLRGEEITAEGVPGIRPSRPRASLRASARPRAACSRTNTRRAAHPRLGFREGNKNFLRRAASLSDFYAVFRAETCKNAPK